MINGVKHLNPSVHPELAVKLNATMATQYGVANAEVTTLDPAYLIGKITASGKYQERPVWQLAASAAQGATVVKVSHVPTAFRVGVAITALEGALSEDLGAIVSIDFTKDPIEITVTNAVADAGGFSTAAILHLTTLDGSEVPVGILANSVELKDMDQVVPMFVKGFFNTTDLLGLYKNGSTSFLWDTELGVKTVEGLTILY